MTTHTNANGRGRVVMNETPQATRGQCGLETRWLSGSVVSGWLPVCWQAGWQRDPTRMPARLPCRTPHLIQSWGSAFLRLGLARRRMSAKQRSRCRSLGRSGHRRDRQGRSSDARSHILRVDLLGRTCESGRSDSAVWPESGSAAGPNIGAPVPARGDTARVFVHDEDPHGRWGRPSVTLRLPYQPPSVRRLFRDVQRCERK
jgi:hypothetical protein